MLARAAAGWDRATWLTWRDEPAGPEAAARFEAMASRRERREPVAYITGVREFWGLDFIVSPAVLIPRPETELIVEAALERLADPARAWRIADVGTGSGCIAVALATERRAAMLTATDISEAALEVARQNATLRGVGSRIGFLPHVIPERRNRPVRSDRRQPSVRAHVRAHGARTGRQGVRAGRGTLWTRRRRPRRGRAILAQAATRLAPGGWLLMEFGYGQGDEVREAASRVPGLRVEMILRDFKATSERSSPG